MEKSSIVLMYEAMPQDVAVGLSYNPRLKVLLKRQLLREATEALFVAQQVGDEVLIASFEASLERLQKLLDLLIPPELEELYLIREDLEADGA